MVDAGEVSHRSRATGAAGTGGAGVLVGGFDVSCAFFVVNDAVRKRGNETGGGHGTRVMQRRRRIKTPYPPEDA